MTLYSKKLRSTFHDLLLDMSDSLEDFVVDPKKDFTRNGKEAFMQYMLFLCTMTGGTYTDLSYKFHNKRSDYLSASAICQARQKIKVSAFEHLLYTFNHRVSATKNYLGYNLLAVDGSAIPIYRNPKSENGTFIKKRGSYRGFNNLHLNGAYDLCNKIYVDAVIQPRAHINEYLALNKMVSRASTPEKNIYICDRGYASYNCMANIIENKGYFLIRGKDITSNGIATKMGYPQNEDTFDYILERVFTKKCQKIYRQNPSKYKIISANTTFDFLSPENPFYTMKFRIVRVQLENGHYEVLLTNLDQDLFPAEKLKEIYNLRWGIETAFRRLKYTIGMMSFHSKKVELIKQEIYAALFIYNFSSLVANNTKIKKKRRKYRYFVNFSVSVTVCLDLLKSLAYLSPPDDCEAILLRNLTPIRSGRKYKRYPTRRRAWTSFNYRVA